MSAGAISDRGNHWAWRLCFLRHERGSLHMRRSCASASCVGSQEIEMNTRSLPSSAGSTSNGNGSSKDSSCLMYRNDAVHLCPESVSANPGAFEAFASDTRNPVGTGSPLSRVRPLNVCEALYRSQVGRSVSTLLHQRERRNANVDENAVAMVAAVRTVVQKALSMLICRGYPFCGSGLQVVA